jgi:integrase
MANAFFRLRKATEKTPQLIYIGCRFGKDQLIISTGIKILPEHWNFKKSTVKNVVDEPQKDSINKSLSDLKDFVNEVITTSQVKDEYLSKESLKTKIENYLSLDKKDEIGQFVFDLNSFITEIIIEAKTFKKKPLSKSDLISQIDAYLHPKTGQTLFEFIAEFIKDSEEGRRLIDGSKQANLRTIQKYKTTELLLSDFAKTSKRVIDFDTIDLDFYKDFGAYMAKKKNYSPSTMGKHVSILKTFLREATENGKNTNLKFQSKAFKTVTGESDSIALTEKELSELYKLDLANNTRLEKVRDLFLIGANTGLRFSDFTDIKPENIKKDENGYYLDLVQFKTKNKVIIPINEMALSILSKYNNQLPPAISNQKFNDYIKELAQLLPALREIETKSTTKGGKTYEETFERWQMISSHTARRSFSTNAYERGTPAISIMQITGHRTEKAFLGYIKTNKKKHAEIVRQHQKQ